MTRDLNALADRFLPHWLCPDWLGQDEADGLLGYADANQHSFKPSEVRRREGGSVDREKRESLRLGDLGPFAYSLHERAEAVLPELCRRLGIAPFRPRRLEIELVAHGDGAFFARHIDTIGHGGVSPSLRRVTAIAYLHRRPKVFSGGALRYYTLNAERHMDIDPEHRSLLSFPSFAPHSVGRVSVPSREFGDSRFAVDMWFHG